MAMVCAVRRLLSGTAWVALGCLLVTGTAAWAQESMSPSEAPQGRAAAPVAEDQTPAPVRPAPPSNFDKALFEKPIPADQLTFLNQFGGATSDELFRDKQFRKLMKSFVPDCTFHYGRDMSLMDALETVFKGSRAPVEIRERRYVVLTSSMGPYLAGHAMLWVDMQDGIGMGAFFFHPTNGEPTPSVNVFSRQVRDEALALSEMPPGFAEDLSRWSPSVTTRYFLTGTNKKVLLEHDEDFCSPTDGTVAGSGDECETLNADAAEFDMNAAYYLEQTHHATNATAWMITGEDQVAWLRVRENTCGLGPGRLGCRIRVTRERTHVILHRGPVGRPVHR